MRREARSRAVAAAVVAAAHLALLLFWLQDTIHRPGTLPSPRISMRLIAAPAPAPPALTTATTVTRPTHAPARRGPVAPRIQVPRPEGISTQAITMQAIAPEPAASQAAATAPEATGSLLDSEATRRALRASARDPGLAARAGRVGSAPLSADERLGAAVQQGARGDCLKGEYLGAGMGLLSLPFLAAAALREQCRR